MAVRTERSRPPVLNREGQVILPWEARIIDRYIKNGKGSTILTMPAEELLLFDHWGIGEIDRAVLEQRKFRTDSVNIDSIGGEGYIPVQVVEVAYFVAACKSKRLRELDADTIRNATRHGVANALEVCRRDLEALGAGNPRVQTLDQLYRLYYLTASQGQFDPPQARMHKIS